MNPNKTVRPWILACGKQYGINHAYEYRLPDASSRQEEMYCTYQFISGVPTQAGQVDMSAELPRDVQRARGTLTFVGNPSADETFVIGSTTLTAKADGSGNVNHFTIGADATETAQNVVTTLAECSEKDNIKAWFVPDTAVIEWLTPGIVGNAVTFTEGLTNGSADGSGVLGGTRAGAASHDIDRRGVQQHSQTVQIDMYNSEDGMYELEAFGVAAHHSPDIRAIFTTNGCAFGQVLSVTNMTEFDSDADIRYHHRMICTFTEFVDISLEEINAIVDSILTDIDTITYPA